MTLEEGKLLDAFVVRVSNVNVHRPGDVDSVWDTELPMSRTLIPTFLEEGPARIESLHPIVDAIGDVDVSIRVHSESIARVELPVAYF